MIRETWIVWTMHGWKEIEVFRGTKTNAIDFYNKHKHKLDNLHYGKLILEKVNNKWVDR
jgi:hypothetical protein